MRYKNERLTEILQAIRATFYYCITTIYQFIKPFMDNKMSIFEGYGAFKFKDNYVNMVNRKTQKKQILFLLLIISSDSTAIQPFRRFIWRYV